MQEGDIKQLLTILKLNYPATYRDMNIEERKALVKIWLNAFGGLDTVVVGHALQNYIKANKYPPTIAGMWEQISMITDSDNSPEELWNKVYKAICNSGYRAQEEFEKLPVCCQKWLGGASALKDLGMTDIDVVNTVTRGQFLKTIGEISDRQEVQEKLPESVRQALGGALQIGE